MTLTELLITSISFLTAQLRRQAAQGNPTRPLRTLRVMHTRPSRISLSSSCRRTALVLFALAPACFAQDTARSGPLYEELARMDSELFETAFVTCNAGKFQALFTDDAEFYHDRTGASYGDAARTLRSCPRDNGVTRTLVPASLEVYPMQGYGAIQIGKHVFAKAGEPGSETAQFVHLWKREGDKWRLARVLSFDHRPSGQQKQ
ncbi:MAG: nuclear transport factor 2 family protein [Burkholderiaceae bacterium]